MEKLVSGNAAARKACQLLARVTGGDADDPGHRCVRAHRVIVRALVARRKGHHDPLAVQLVRRPVDGVGRVVSGAGAPPTIGDDVDAEPVRIRGRLSRRGDMLMLSIDPATIERLP